jgi:hypothetical protein
LLLAQRGRERERERELWWRWRWEERGGKPGKGLDDMALLWNRNARNKSRRRIMRVCPKLAIRATGLVKTNAEGFKGRRSAMIHFPPDCATAARPGHIMGRLCSSLGIFEREPNIRKFEYGPAIFQLTASSPEPIDSSLAARNPPFRKSQPSSFFMGAGEPGRLLLFLFLHSHFSNISRITLAMDTHTRARTHACTDVQI